ncbi:MAG: transposase [Xanthobacteraceae bacterium]
MVSQTPLLMQLLALIDQLPLAASAVRRGRPCVYSERLFLKAVVVMVLRHLPTVHALVAVLEQPEMAAVRAALGEHEHFPTRRTFERRLKALPTSLPDQIALVGEHLMALLDPWAEGGHAVAIDSTVLPARGGVWHKKYREVGEVPHTSIDTEAHWTKSGWHGWVYGWKLHLIVTVAGVWLPLAAELTPANAADNEQAPSLLNALTLEHVFVLGDTAYNDPEIRQHCVQHQRTLVATKRGAYPHPDDGVAVRRLFHELRSRAIENFNGQFKGIFDCSRPVPTKGLIPTQRYVLGAVLVYQLALLHQFQIGGDLRRGLKPLLQAA